MLRVKVVTVMRWYAQDEVNQEDSEQNEVNGLKKELIPQVRWCISTRAVGDCNEEDTDGRASVARDEERVLPVDWTEMRLCR